MVYKNFRLNVIVRVILLSLTIFGFFFLVFRTSYLLTPILVFMIIIYQIYRLIYYVDTVNYDLSVFFESIKYNEFNRTFKIDGLGSSFDDLARGFNEVIEKFQKIRSEKEAQYHYLQNVIQHIGISLLAFTEDGDIQLINNAAQKLFGTPNPKNIKDLSGFSEELVKTLYELKSGRKKLIKVNDEDDLLQLAIYAKEFGIKDQYIKLVSIQNIQSELEEQEMQSWQKLIRVLTHEIMNSITPISSLSVSVNAMLSEMTGDHLSKQIDDEKIDDIQYALTTIQRRSDGLLQFVDSYRNLTRIRKPDFKIFSIQKLFSDIQLLMADELRAKQVEFTTDVEPQSLELTADRNLIEQVLINLVKNSLNALDDSENPNIQMTAFLSKEGRIGIKVMDNGSGILTDVIDKVFIPFFTTKSEGSGIGLSLSRQIMRLHGGTISVNSIPDERTTVTLKF